MRRCKEPGPVADRPVAILACLAAILWTAGTQSAVAQDSPQARCAEIAASQSATPGAMAESGQAAAVPQASAGMRAYVDPETGELTVPPKDARAVEAPAAEAATSTSHEGLVEVPSPVPGGGVMIDLKGRFRSALTATLSADGKVMMAHVPCMPVARDGE